MTVTISTRHTNTDAKQYVVRDSLFHRERICQTRDEAVRVKNHWLAEGFTRIGGHRA